MILAHRHIGTAASYLVMAWSLSATPAAAQNSDDRAGSAPAAATEAGPTGSEIVVTAQRRTERLQDVPIAVAAVSQVQAERLGLANIVDIGAVVPGASFQFGTGFFQPYIRGLGSAFVHPGLESPVAVYQDGAYMPRMLGLAEMLDNVDQASVQVLRGPQGTLYGRNATGGVVIINSADPSDRLEAKFKGEYGRFDHIQSQAVLNVPLGHDLSVRLVGRYLNEKGYIHNIADNSMTGARNVYQFRAKLRWNPGWADVILGGNYIKTRLNMNTGVGGANSPICFACNLLGVISNTGNFYEQSSSPVPPQAFKAWGLTLNATFQVGEDFSLKSLTTYRKQDGSAYSDQDFTAAPLFVYSFPFSGGKTFTQDVQLTSNFGGPLNFLAGATYMKDKGGVDLQFSGGLYDPLIPIFGAYPTILNRAQTESIAVFGEAYFKATENLKITVGGRFTHDKRQFLVRNNASAVAALGLPLASFQQNSKFDAFTPRFTIAWDNGPTNLYYSFTRGFKSGGFSVPQLVPLPPVKSEKISSHEIGIKQSAFDNKLRVNLAAYYFKNSDLQVQYVSSTGDTISSNAGALESYGVEFDAQVTPVHNLNLGVTLAWQHPRYKPFRDAVQYCFDPTGALSPIPGATLYNCKADLTGTAPPNAPSWSGSFSANYEFNVSDWTVSLSGLATFRSRIDFYPGASGPLRYDRDPSRWLVNSSGYISPPGGHVRFGYYVNNLFNKNYAKYRQTTPPFGVVYEPGMPRTYGMRFEFEF